MSGASNRGSLRLLILRLAIAIPLLVVWVYIWWPTWWQAVTEQ